MRDMAATADASEKGKGSPLVMTIAGLLVLTVLGGGGGWFLGTVVAPRIKAATAAVQASAKTGEGEKQAPAAVEPNMVPLEPIIANLGYPSQNWIRLEIALVFKGQPDAQLAGAIHQDILAYIRTVSLQQIEGPRGLQYLRDDIQERVDLRSEGRVSKVMFRTFVIE
ncbi:flagellar basal body-associated FliL family protein [Rhizobium sp. BK602]|uniref:flagellar basal body-associated FliL family protein n=1 Tax=Rhizobium sp. BK602 TaxID=2586986 RepID=UPI001617CFA7|nr:flagellar basal body-associated FliL family protein [Rhizobium sp. BK602]